ncbi:hypothetical protein K227x_01310 [Rubripirellula lacrimiformis]|uniref:Uncharacterized protein n=1 Tax=Rubripirellula lacrimiformis TaxID=1930273 RepID=A0A517N3Q3_9BACT|nr:hypothetical protein K227x_01310 [Rubripirellula lacrimiformis]
MVNGKRKVRKMNANNQSEEQQVKDGKRSSHRSNLRSSKTWSANVGDQRVGRVDCPLVKTCRPDSVESLGYLFARTSRRTSGRQAVSLPGMESAGKFSGVASARGSAVVRVDHGVPSSIEITSCAPRPSVPMHQKTRRFSTNNGGDQRAGEVEFPFVKPHKPGSVASHGSSVLGFDCEATYLISIVRVSLSQSNSGSRKSV